jgi:argininosuccinate lyase
MSTKIYLAYRCSVKKLNELLLSFREHCFSKVQERTEVLMAAVTPEQIRKYYDDKEWNMSYEEFLTKKKNTSDSDMFL